MFRRTAITSLFCIMLLALGTMAPDPAVAKKGKAPKHNSSACDKNKKDKKSKKSKKSCKSKKSQDCIDPGSNPGNDSQCLVTGDALLLKLDADKCDNNRHSEKCDKSKKSCKSKKSKKSCKNTKSKKSQKCHKSKKSCKSNECVELPGNNRAVWKLTNEGSDTVTIDTVTLCWPPELGNLRFIKLGTEIIFDGREGSEIAPPYAVIDTWDVKNKSLRIKADERKRLKFRFEHEAETTQNQYGIIADFLEGCSVMFGTCVAPPPEPEPEPEPVPVPYGDIDLEPGVDSLGNPGYYIVSKSEAVMDGRFELVYENVDGDELSLPFAYADAGMLGEDGLYIDATLGPLDSDDDRMFVQFEDPTDVEAPGTYLLIFQGQLGAAGCAPADPDCPPEGPIVVSREIQMSRPGVLVSFMKDGDFHYGLVPVSELTSKQVEANSRQAASAASLGVTLPMRGLSKKFVHKGTAMYFVTLPGLLESGYLFDGGGFSPEASGGQSYNYLYLPEYGQWVNLGLALWIPGTIRPVFNFSDDHIYVAQARLGDGFWDYDIVEYTFTPGVPGETAFSFSQAIVNTIPYGPLFLWHIEKNGTPLKYYVEGFTGTLKFEDEPLDLEFMHSISCSDDDSSDCPALYSADVRRRWSTDSGFEWEMVPGQGRVIASPITTTGHEGYSTGDMAQVLDGDFAYFMNDLDFMSYEMDGSMYRSSGVLDVDWDDHKSPTFDAVRVGNGDLIFKAKSHCPSTIPKGPALFVNNLENLVDGYVIQHFLGTTFSCENISESGVVYSHYRGDYARADTNIVKIFGLSSANDILGFLPAEGLENDPGFAAFVEACGN